MRYCIIVIFICLAFESVAQNIFTKKYPYDLPASIRSVCRAPNDGVLIYYSVDDNSCSCTHYQIMRCSDTGDSLWGKVLLSSVGKFEAAYTGYYSFDFQDLVRYDSAGNYLWTFSTNMLVDYIEDVTQTADSGFLVLGIKDTITFGTNPEKHLYKLDKNGNRLWEKYYYGSYNNQFIRAVNNGAIIYSSTTANREFRYMKIDNNGDSIWSMVFSQIIVSSPGVTDGMTIFPNGDIASIIGCGIYYAVLKTDSSGNMLSIDSIYSDPFLQSNTIGLSYVTAASNGEILVTGSNSAPDWNILLYSRSYNPDGIINRLIGGSPDEYGMFLFRTQDGGYYLVGQVDSTNEHSIVIMKNVSLSNLYYAVAESEKMAEINLFPNPVNDYIYLRTEELKNFTTIDIYETCGEKIFSSELNTPVQRIDCSEFAPGLYTVIFSGKKKAVSRFIKE
jgi:hypothetical protein